MALKKNILLVEHDHRQKVIICRALEEWGYLITTAFDGTDAVEKIKSGVFPFVIVDFQMPGISGIDFLKQVKAYDENVEVLFLASNVKVKDAVEAMKEGAFDFALKPVNNEQLKLFAQSVFSKKTDSKSNNTSINSKKSGKESSLPNLKTSIVNPLKIITQNQTMLRLLDLVSKVAVSSATVLVQGESGTGKELFANFLHKSSGRKGSFVAVNCAALPEALLESELFGHEKGAFTGAVTRKIGKFEMAHGGTILLDEITEMQLHLQSKLLRVIQERVVDRVGGTVSIPVDVRIVATTNREMQQHVKDKEFREDLYYRLSTIPIKIPSLRERKDDIQLLASHFIKKYNLLDSRNVKGLTKSALAQLEKFDFSGNVRELENIIQRAILLCDGVKIREHDLFLEKSLGESISFIPSAPSILNADELVDTIENKEKIFDFVPGPLKEMEEKMIFRTLDKTAGNRTRAAQILGISVRTLRNKLNEYKDKA